MAYSPNTSAPKSVAALVSSVIFWQCCKVWDGDVLKTPAARNTEHAESRRHGENVEGVLSNLNSHNSRYSWT